MRRRVALILLDPPYNTRRARNKFNSDHGTLSEGDIDLVVNDIDDLPMPGGHALIFCSAIQFAKFYELFINYRKDGERPAKFQRTDTWGRRLRNQFFSAEETPMVFIKKKNNIVSRRFRSFGHVNGYEMAIHLWKPNGPVHSQTRVNYRNQGYIVEDGYPRLSNVMAEIPRVVKSEAGRVRPSSSNDGSASGAAWKMIIPEQKSVVMLAEIKNQYLNPGDIVVKQFGGTFATAKECLLSGRPLVFVCCEIDRDCTKTASDDLVRCFLTTVLRDEYPLPAKDEEKSGLRS